MEMKVALFQMDIQWHEPHANRRKAEDFIITADADLVVLPEMFTTGFDTSAVDMAEPMSGPTAAWMSELAAGTGKAIMGSVIVRDGTRGVFNRLLFAEPGGTLQYYDKRHLFSYGGEHKLFTAGEKRVIMEYKGFRILSLVCYDLRFPVWSRGSNDFDLLVYVASWSEGRIGAWDALLKARAIENQCYAIGVNRVGDDPSAHYNGHTQAVDYFGHTLGMAADNTEESVCVVLDRERLDAYRDKFRAWEDADRFEVKV